MNNSTMELTLEIESPKNQLAVAVARGEDDEDFLSANKIFSAFFPGIHSPSQLLELITNKSDNKTIVTFNEGVWELLLYHLNDHDVLYFLKNITFEWLALKQLKNQLKELTDTRDIYDKILGKDLPIGAMVIDEEYNVYFVNQTLRSFFRIPSMLNLKKCYNYVREIKPCDNCVLQSYLSNKGNKRSFVLENGHRIITADIHPAGDKYIYMFRDTTKEINLIKEIKKQQEELQAANHRIAQQNEILKGLSNVNARVGQMRNLEAILETVLNSIINTFVCGKGAILLFNETGKIKNAYFSKNVMEPERSFIIESISDISGSGSPKMEGYITQDMVVKEKVTGRLFLFNPGNTIDQSILGLFLMQISSYLVNLELQRKLEEVAQTDSLTGVFNRYYFDKRFEEEKELSKRFGQPLSLMMVDVNGLKEINDRLGHDAGDLLLERTAALLSANISEYDSIYRIGGDEFVILLSNCPKEQLIIMINMIKELQKEATFDYNDTGCEIRFSLGGVCSSEVPHNRLKEEADKRMYLDKERYYEIHERYR